MEPGSGRKRIGLTKPQLAGEAIAIILLIGMFAYVALQWNDLPAQVPGHFNAMGEVDRWGDKNEIWTLPAVTAILFVFLTVIAYLPPLLRVPPKEGDPMNWDQVYLDMRNLMILVKIELSALFFFVTYHVATSAPLPIWYLPVFLAAVMGTSAIYLGWIVRKALVAHIKAGMK